MIENNPNEEIAVKIFNRHVSGSVAKITRFQTGLCHFVYDITTSNGSTYALRISNEASSNLIESGIYWNKRLSSINIPVPQIYAFQIAPPRSYMLIERFAGADLGCVYGSLSSESKKRIASSIARFQNECDQRTTLRVKLVYAYVLFGLHVGDRADVQQGN